MFSWGVQGWRVDREDSRTRDAPGTDSKSTIEERQVPAFSRPGVLARTRLAAGLTGGCQRSPWSRSLLPDPSGCEQLALWGVF